MDNETLKTLLRSVDEEFFDCLEKCTGFTIQKAIRNILKFSYYNSAVTIATITEKELQEIEEVMRSDFDVGLVPGDQLPEYLCRYAADKTKFKLIGGQIKLILALANYCSKLNHNRSANEIEVSAPEILSLRANSSSLSADNSIVYDGILVCPMFLFVYDNLFVVIMFQLIRTHPSLLQNFLSLLVLI